MDKFATWFLMFFAAKSRLIEIERALLMPLKNRRRDLRRYVAFDRIANRLGFALVGHRANNRSALHDLPHAHRDRLLRHIVERREPTFAQLLAAAGVVELDDQVGFFGFEIGRRIVEREVAIFADADKGNVDRMPANDLGHAAAFGSRRRLRHPESETPAAEAAAGSRIVATNSRETTPDARSAGQRIRPDESRSRGSN